MSNELCRYCLTPLDFGINECGCDGERMAELEAENKRLREALKLILADTEPTGMVKLHTPMVRFIQMALDATFDGCDYEGGDMQNDMAAVGLLKEETMTEPCHSGCQCAELVGEFPTQCYRVVPELLEAFKALEEGDE